MNSRKKKVEKGRKEGSGKKKRFNGRSEGKYKGRCEQKERKEKEEGA